jgi:hypothetical protein
VISHLNCGGRCGRRWGEDTNMRIVKFPDMKSLLDSGSGNTPAGISCLVSGPKGF